MLTSIQKWGNSQGIRLPKSILEELLLHENDYIVIRKATRKRRSKVSLEARFANYSGKYQCEEIDWGKQAGNEVW